MRWSEHYLYQSDHRNYVQRYPAALARTHTLLTSAGFSVCLCGKKLRSIALTVRATQQEPLEIIPSDTPIICVLFGRRGREFALSLLPCRYRWMILLFWGMTLAYLFAPTAWLCAHLRPFLTQAWRLAEDVKLPMLGQPTVCSTHPLFSSVQNRAWGTPKISRWSTEFLLITVTDSNKQLPTRLQHPMILELTCSPLFF